MEKELLFLKRLPKAQSQREAFVVRESGFPQKDGHVVEVAFNDRYPLQVHTKARNNVSSMTNVVVSGKLICFFLEGEGSVHIFSAGDTYHIPRGAYYILSVLDPVVLINISVPPWSAEDRDIQVLTEEEKKLLWTLGEKAHEILSKED